MALVHVSLVKTPNDGRLKRCSQLCTMFSNCNTNKGEGGKGEEVFEAMWNNTGIRSELWNTIPGGSEAIKKANAKSNFYVLSQNTNSILYRFVN